jgi:hypothetical protein
MGVHPGADFIRTIRVSALKEGTDCSWLQLHQEIDLPDRKTYLRTAIFDANSGNIGTLQIPLVSTHSNQ